MKDMHNTYRNSMYYTYSQLPKVKQRKL